MVTEVSESTRREYAARMNRVVDYIESHLADPLDLEQLAGVACFSNPWEVGADISLEFSKLAGPIVREEIPMTKIPFEVQVRRLAPATLAYIRHIGPYKGDTAKYGAVLDSIL